MILLAAAAFAGDARTTVTDVVGVAGIAAMPVGVGLAVGGTFSGSAPLTDAGVATTLLAPPLLCGSTIWDLAAAKKAGVTISPAPEIVSLVTWASATGLYFVATTNSDYQTTNVAIATVALYGASYVSGVVGRVQAWDQRPRPKTSIDVVPTGTGLAVTGTF